MDNTQNIIELCAGYGGISMGIKRVIPDIRVRAFCEIEAYAVANLVQKIEEGKMDEAPIWTNIKTFPGKEFYGKIHGIVGGYPCQPFSQVGKRNGKQHKGHIFPDILRIVQAVKPLWCFFENVEGHLTLGYSEVYRSLRDMGYTVEAGLFSAQECGAPHYRKRLFILAYTTSNREHERRNRDRNNKNGFWIQKKNRRSIRSGPKRLCAENRNSEKQRYPAWPKDEQYKWEAPRTIEPSLGRTVNGTSSRVDRIRMLGNGVVPDTAELAFRTLIKMKLE